MLLFELIRGLSRSIHCALHGLSLAFRSQRNVRIHLLAAVVVLASAVYLRFSRQEMVLLILTIGLVLAGELLNTALEVALNLLESRHHPAVRHSKDIAAGAVLVTVFGSVAVAVLLFVPHVRLLLGK